MATARSSASEYLLAVLACRGPDAAERRLALREEWQMARAASDADEREAFEEASWQVCRGAGDPATDLRRWLDSPREDLREAARRGTEIGCARERLADLWPKPLSAALFEWWLTTLVHAAERGVESRRKLGATLAPAPDSAAAFGQFLRQACLEFPELGIEDPVAAAATERGPHAPAAGEAVTGPFVRESLKGTAKLAILAALALLAGRLMSQGWWTSSLGGARPTVPFSPIPSPGAAR